MDYILISADTVAGSTAGYPASPRSYRPHAYADVAGDNDTLLLRKAADESGRAGMVKYIPC